MDNKRILGIFFIAIAVVMAITQIYVWIISDYVYERDVLYSWNLADKSSSLESKSFHLNKFIQNLEKAKFSEYNAIFLKTPDNDIQNNIKAVKTLKTRLDEIKDLDPESFAYQTAIQQITEQEQGEAQVMLSTIKDGWLLGNGYWIVWFWFGFVYLIVWLPLGMIGLILTIRDNI